MKKTTVLAAAIAVLYVCSPSLAEDPKISASAGLTGQIVEVKGNEAKFNEYRDAKDGVYGDLSFSYGKGGYYFSLEGRDFGYDTQKYRLEGGKWGAFKYDFFYREIPHNITFGAVTPYSGAGSNDLTYGGAFPLGSNSWTGSFDYSTLRKQYGGNISVDAAKPFFFALSADREDRSGIKPAGVAISSSAFPSLELPEPVDYVTNTLSAIAGYSQNPFYLAFNFMYSNFENRYDTLNFLSPDFGGPVDSLTLPPDNHYYKFGFKGSVKLPLNSRFSLNVNRARSSSEASLLTSINSSGLPVPISVSDSKFDGKINTTRGDALLSGSPLSFLDAKFFAKYYDRENKSDEIITDGNPFSVNSRLSYRKYTYGGELGFKLPERFYLSTGFTYVNTNRDLDTLADTLDRIWNVGLRWRGLDFMTVRVGYENLNRSASFIEDSQARNYDLADKDRDAFKFSVDIFPIDNLALSAGYKYKKTDYRDYDYGLTSDKRDEFNASIDYTLSKWAQFFAYWDYEKIRTLQAQSTYLWDMKDRHKNYDYGIGTDIYIIPKMLTLRLQYDYLKANGNVDLTIKDPNGFVTLPGATNNSIDIGNWDDYKKRTYLVKMIYEPTKKITLSAGYAYEKYSYSDLQLEDYSLVPDIGGSNGAFLSGAYKDQSYKANIFFTSISYRLW